MEIFYEKEENEHIRLGKVWLLTMGTWEVSQPSSQHITDLAAKFRKMGMTKRQKKGEKIGK